jgi:hypothetical protein
MNKLRLFQYAVLWHPTEKEAKEEGLKTKVLVEPKTILSSDDKSAAMMAAMEIPQQYKESLEQIDIIIRPF